MYKRLASRKTANLLIATIFIILLLKQAVLGSGFGQSALGGSLITALLVLTSCFLVLNICLCTGQRNWKRNENRLYKYQGSFQGDSFQMAALKTKLKIKGSIKTGGFSYSSMFFHLSLVGMLVGLLVSVLFGFYGKIIITEGQVLPQQAASYQSVQKGIWASWPDFTYSLGLDTTEVRYQPGMAEPTDLSAQLIIMQNDNLNTSTTLKPNHSFNYEGVNIALEDFGLAPKVQLVGEDGQQEEMYVNLIWDTKDGIVYIGKDVVDLPGRALKISLKVYPDAKFLPDGTLTTISNELKAPAVWVEVNARGKSVFQGPALLGQKMRCSNGMVVIVPEIRKWVSLIIKRDLGYLIMLVFAVSSAIALGLAVLCPPYKLEFGENQLCWFTDKHPHLLLDKLQN